MKLIDVYSINEAPDLLWSLLSERRPEASISHKAMPTMPEHLTFIASRPYMAWYLIDVGQDNYAGAVYLTREREIGIAILKRFFGFGYGKMAVRMLMDKHPGRFLANVAPRNFVSQAMFTDMGGKIVQHTFELKGETT